MASRKVLELNGNFFESVITANLESAFPDAKVFHNFEVYSDFLKKNTQIDVLLVHKTGIYVLEAKNWTDWVKGNYNDRQWSGASSHGAPMIVRSPLDQNFLHIRALKNAFRKKGFNPPDFYNLIVFPDGIAINSDCKEICTSTQLEFRIKMLMEKSNKNYSVARCAQILMEITGD